MKHLALLAVIALASCGGGGGSSPAPTVAPTTAPTTAPQRKVRTAPIGSAPSASQSLGRSGAEASLSTLSSVLIESSGTTAAWAGNIVVWVTDSNGNDVVETTGTATETNGIAINNPALEPLACTGSNQTSSTWCAAHPNGWWFGTADVLVKPIGQQTITIAFGDGTTGTITDDIYNGFSLQCGQSMAYQSGVPAVVTTSADVTYDCINQQMIFPHGVTVAAQPALDSVGRSSTVIASVTSPVAVGAGDPTSIAFSAFTANAVYVFGTGDGGSAKMLPSGTGSSSFTALSLKALTDGSFAY